MIGFFLFLWATYANAQHFIIGCEIRDSKLEVVRVLPSQGARYCWPFADGGWVSAGDTGLTKWARDGTKLWHHKGVFHHQVRVDEKGNVLALGREWITYRGRKHRFDTVLKYNGDGKELAKLRLSQNLIAIQKGKVKYGERFNFPLWYTVEDDVEQASPFFQFSHLNSIQILPAAVRSKAGHYLIHEPIHGVCLGLDENLKLNGFTYEIPRANPKVPAIAHDCQMLADGSMLYYLNKEDGASFRIYRRLGDKVLFAFPRSPKDGFKTPFCGGAAAIPEGYAVSIVRLNSSDLGVVGFDGKWKRKVTLPFPIQDMKVLPDVGFLKKNEIR